DAADRVHLDDPMSRSGPYSTPPAGHEEHGATHRVVLRKRSGLEAAGSRGEKETAVKARDPDATFGILDQRNDVQRVLRGAFDAIHPAVRREAEQGARGDPDVPLAILEERENVGRRRRQGNPLPELSAVRGRGSAYGPAPEPERTVRRSHPERPVARPQ